MDITSQKLISASLLRLRMKAPFFATLALFTRFIPTRRHPTAATDGKDIYYNPDFLSSLRQTEQDSLLLHEVLHAALLHALRRGVRDRKLWNIAADIVVNGIIAQQSGFELPQGGIRDPKLERFSVEEIYELLQQESESIHDLPSPDLLDEPLESPSTSPGTSNAADTPDNQRPTRSSEMDSNGGSGSETETTEDGNDGDSQSTAQGEGGSPDKMEDSSVSGASTTIPGNEAIGEAASTDAESHADGEIVSSAVANSLSEAQKAAIEAHWQRALQQAAIIARTTSQGNLPAGLDRELGQITGPQLDWRAHLWRYLVQTPTDFQGFDRRFIHQGLYLESLQGESVQVYLCIDTSGSIDGPLLDLFLGEVRGILSTYPHLTCELYYADADIYGPHELDTNSQVPPPQGGGGTSFIPFFEQVNERWDQITQGLCIYLTDGYGTFPSEVPELPVLWVVAPGGLVLEQFPFGEAVRLLSL
jgi:predicted metal-dependent peptidase